MKNSQLDTGHSLDQTSELGAIATSILHLPANVLTLFGDWQHRASQRTHLRDLDDRLLKDMGLTRTDVFREASKPFWVK